MNFEEALLELKNGNKVKRELWSDDYYIYLDKNSTLKNSSGAYVSILGQDEILANDWEIYKFFAQGMFVQGTNSGCKGLLLGIDRDTLFVLTECGGIGRWTKKYTRIISNEHDTLYIPIIEKIRKLSAGNGE